MSMLIDTKQHDDAGSAAGWVHTPPQPAPGWAPAPPQASPYPIGNVPPAAPAPAPASPALFAKLTPTSLLLVIALVAGGGYWYSHRQHPTPPVPIVAPAPGPVTIAPGPSGGTTSGIGTGTTGAGTGTTGAGTGTGQGNTPPGGSSTGTGGGTGQGSSPPSTEADQALLTHVPAIMQSCTPYAVSGAAAALMCRATAQYTGLAVVYAQYTAGTLASGFSSLSGGLHLVAVAGCSSGQCTYGGQNTNDSGHVDWFTTNLNNGPAIGAVWTSDRTDILGFAVQAGTDATSFVNWWQNSSGPN
jgi:hypothetical protein